MKRCLGKYMYVANKLNHYDQFESDNRLPNRYKVDANPS